MCGRKWVMSVRGDKTDIQTWLCRQLVTGSVRYSCDVYRLSANIGFSPKKAYVVKGWKMFIDMSVRWVDWNTINHFWSWCDYNIVFEKHLSRPIVHSSLVLVIIDLGNHCVPPMADEGWPGILLRRSEESPFWRSTDALVRRWLMVSPSSWPVCLASADPSFLSCSRATLCHPPSDSAAMGIKAIPCWSQRSAVTLVKAEWCIDVEWYRVKDIHQVPLMH